jgi:hypothetical protein
MQLRAQHIFARLSPYQVVVGLGLSIEQRDGLFFTPHPKNPDHLLQIREREFVAHANGPTPALNLFDFLALHFGSYRRALEHVINQYYNLAALPVGLNWEGVLDELVDGLRTERDQFERILSLREPLRLRLAPIEAYPYCRGRQLALGHIWRMLYIVRGKELNQALQHLPGWTPGLDPEERCLVIPFFKNYHTFALLEIYNLERKLLKTFHLNPSQHMFFGLHTCFPNNSQTRIYSTPETAAQSYSYAMETAEYRTGFVHTRFNPSGEPSEPLLKSGLFIVTQDTDFNSLVNNRRAFEQLEVFDPDRRFGDTSKPVRWPDYAAQSVLKRFAKDPKDPDRVYSLQTSAMIESLRADPEAFAALQQSLSGPEHASVLHQIQRRRGGRQLFVLRDVHVAETPGGYVASKPSTNLNSHFTNFVIKLDSRIWFEESKQTYFSGWIYLSQKPVPFLLSDSQRHQPKAIILQAQRDANRVGDPSLPLPTIADMAQQSKLVSIISQQVAHTTQIIGIQRLGWNGVKRRFIAPVWQAGQAGVEATSKIPHPESEILARNYHFLDYKCGEASSQTTPQARYLIAILVAYLARGFLNLQTVPVTILRSPGSFTLLQSVFRPLGQIAPIELPPNRRALQCLLFKQNLSAYPIFATCCESKVLDRISYPIFLLANSGTPLGEILTTEAYSQITGLSHHVITSVVSKLIRNPAQAYGLTLSDQAPSIEQLAQEGTQVIEFSGIPGFEPAEQPLPLLSQVLSRIEPEKASQYFRLDPQSGLVLIRFRLLQDLIPKLTRKPLYHELLAHNPQVKPHGNHYIAAPANWFWDLVAKFYGAPVAQLEAGKAKQPQLQSQLGTAVGQTEEQGCHSLVAQNSIANPAS